MIAERLNYGNTIGLISPSHVAERSIYGNIIAHLQQLGFKVKTGANLYKDTWGSVASATERAEDLNAMVEDPEVKLIFFGGGNGAADILPLIDYEKIKKNPKLFLSYSDGTYILNAIYTKTGLVTYYGQTPGIFTPPDEYTLSQFESHLIRRDGTKHIPSSEWCTLNGGSCEGTLIGGYLPYIATKSDSPYFMFDKKENYILFLEDHEKFNDVSRISSYLAQLEQSDFIKNVSGAVFGHYSDPISEPLLKCIENFGKRNSIPVAYCDDFGHGTNHAILPVGIRTKFDADRKLLEFLN